MFTKLFPSPNIHSILEIESILTSRLLVSEKKARVLSSGCPMVSKNYIDHVIKLLRAPVNEAGEELGNGGVVFIYGEREKNWQGETCKGQFNI